jgi:hypothetical protein
MVVAMRCQSPYMGMNYLQITLFRQGGPLQA